MQSTVSDPERTNWSRTSVFALVLRSLPGLRVKVPVLLRTSAHLVICNSALLPSLPMRQAQLPYGFDTFCGRESTNSYQRPNLARGLPLPHWLFEPQIFLTSSK